MEMILHHEFLRKEFCGQINSWKTSVAFVVCFWNFYLMI